MLQLPPAIGSLTMKRVYHIFCLYVLVEWWLDGLQMRLTPTKGQYYTFTRSIHSRGHFIHSPPPYNFSLLNMSISCLFELPLILTAGPHHGVHKLPPRRLLWRHNRGHSYQVDYRSKGPATQRCHPLQEGRGKDESCHRACGTRKCPAASKTHRSNNVRQLLFSGFYPGSYS